MNHSKDIKECCDKCKATHWEGGVPSIDFCKTPSCPCHSKDIKVSTSTEERLREEFYSWFTARKGKKDIADYWLAKLSQEKSLPLEEVGREVENMLGVTFDPKGEVEVDIKTGMPINVYLKKSDVLDLLTAKKK